MVPVRVPFNVQPQIQPFDGIIRPSQWDEPVGRGPLALGGDGLDLLALPEPRPERQQRQDGRQLADQLYREAGASGGRTRFAAGRPPRRLRKIGPMRWNVRVRS